MSWRIKIADLKTYTVESLPPHCGEESEYLSNLLRIVVFSDMVEPVMSPLIRRSWRS